MKTLIVKDNGNWKNDRSTRAEWQAQYPQTDGKTVQNVDQIGRR